MRQLYNYPKQHPREDMEIWCQTNTKKSYYHGFWDSFFFDNEQDYLMFMLRWS
jgi:hypothetical protein